MTRVVFFQVKDNSGKVKNIVEKAQSHFAKHEPLLIVVEDAKSQTFVDELLWKWPAPSFLPHTATDETTQEKIAITKEKKNVNNAPIAFNLCPTPLLIEGPFRIIYEFEDLSAPNKKNFASLKLDAYRRLGYLIEAI